MSVFGGDSWAREAQYRKRRVDDLLADESCFRKLSNGKYACIVCPNNPVLDSPLLFSMHRNGSRHCAAESRLKQKEANKRMAVPDSQSTVEKHQKHKSIVKPLVEQTKQVGSHVQCNNVQQSSRDDCKKNSRSDQIASEASRLNEGSLYLGSLSAVSDKMVVKQHLDFRDYRERELKFTAAGWKRDGNGKWYKDENVEFDSDEEDPNVCLI